MGFPSSEELTINRFHIQNHATPVSYLRMRTAPFFVSLAFIFALSDSHCSFAAEPPASAPDSVVPSQDAIDDCVRREMDSQHIPGLSLAADSP